MFCVRLSNLHTELGACILFHNLGHFTVTAMKMCTQNGFTRDCYKAVGWNQKHLSTMCVVYCVILAYSKISSRILWSSIYHYIQLWQSVFLLFLWVSPVLMFVSEKDGLHLGCVLLWPHWPHCLRDIQSRCFGLLDWHPY